MCQISINSKRSDKYVAFWDLDIYYKTKKKKKKSKLSTPTRNDKFELTDRAYSASDIQKYFE